MKEQKLFNTPSEVFEAQLNDIFSSSDEKHSSVLKALSLLIHSSTHNTDFVDLYNLLGLENFVSVISLFENRTIKFPSKEEVKELILTSLLYYYREIQNLGWNEIKEKVPFEFSSISYSIKIKKFNEYIREKLFEILTEEET